MKIQSLLLAGVLLAGAANAQTWVSDSVAIGAGYSTDIWYSMANGQAGQAPNDNWTLAFQTTPQGPYGNVAVWGNHVEDTVSIWSLHKSATDWFDMLTAADTAGKTMLVNSDSSWNFGALNANADPTNMFDYGWGMYDMTSHNVLGDSLFLMKSGNNFYKLWIQKYKSLPVDSSTFTFRIARLDGSDDHVVNINRGFYLTKNFAYYKANTNTTLDREPANTSWDILFTRYMDTASQGPITIPYPATGVLSNHGVLVAQADDVTPDMAQMQNYTFHTGLNEIGYDWKTFNMGSGSFAVNDQRSYFIKAKDGQYWQLVFTGFGGSSTGKVVFKKRGISMAVNNVANSSVQRFQIAPIPANNEVNVVLEANAAATGAITITDLQGRAVLSAPIRVQQGLNAYTLRTAQLPAGTYVLQAAGDGFAVSRKIVVAR